MADKEKVAGPRAPYVLAQNSPAYKLVHTALAREKEAGLTPGALAAINPKLATFMKAHHIIKAKPSALINEHDVCLETLRASLTKAQTAKG